MTVRMLTPVRLLVAGGIEQRYRETDKRSAGVEIRHNISPVSGQTQDTAFVLDDDIGAVGEQRPRDRRLRVIAPASPPAT